MSSETIKLKIGYKEPFEFHLKFLSLEEEETLRQKYAALPENDSQKRYELNVESLAKLSDTIPAGMFPNRPEKMEAGDATVYLESFNDNEVSKAVKTYFSEKTIVKERLAEYAMRAYLKSLIPSVNFF